MLFYTVRRLRVLPFISENILRTAITFAKQCTDIFDKNLKIIKHYRKSLLHNDSCFDVTMGSYDGAEVRELVGIYLICLLTYIIDKSNSGLYRDDGLIFLRNMNGKRWIV